MRWLCFLLASTAAAQGGGGGGRPVKPLRFDLAAIPVTRDSFTFFLDRQAHGFAVWQYETRARTPHEEVVYSAYSEFQPVEEERLRVVLDRTSGAPLASYHHIELFSPRSDTLMVEHDLEVKDGRVQGTRKVGTKDGKVKAIPVSVPLPPGTVWSNYELYAAAVTNAEPGDSLAAPDYREFSDSLRTLYFFAEQPTAVNVPAGRFDVLPLRSGDFRLYVTRQPPRRVVKGETLDGRFSFELAHTGPVVPTDP